MSMRWKAALAAIVTFTATTFVQAQTLRVGGSAPELKIDKWVKGEPVTEFQDGKVYVVEFWATWCGPCVQSIPHLTKLQEKYADKGLTIVGITSAETGNDFDQIVSKVESFAAEKKMGYTVAIENPKGERPTSVNYMQAANQRGIPAAFIVDGNQRIAYIGHPLNPAFDTTLSQVIAGEFNMESALREANDAAKAEAKIAEVRKKGDPILAEVNTMMGEGNFSGALARVDDVVRLDSDIYGQVAFTKFQFLMGHPDETVRDQAGALKYAETLMNDLASGNATLQNQLAWVLATMPEAPEGAAPLAVRLGENAVKLTTWSDADYVDTLAAAYNANSQHDMAVKTQMKAIETATNDQQKAEFQQRLEQYQAKLAG